MKNLELLAKHCCHQFHHYLSVKFYLSNCFEDLPGTVRIFLLNMSSNVLFVVSM